MEDDYAELCLVDQGNADPNIQRIIPLPSTGAIRFGRIAHPDFADVAIFSNKFASMVSRRHATIKRLSGSPTWTIIDHKSTNRVLVNMEPIEPETDITLKDGDVITFGTVESDLVYTFEVNRKRGPVQDEPAKDLHQLELCHRQGFFNQEQYEERKQQIAQRVTQPLWIHWERTPRSVADIKGITAEQLRSTPTELGFKYTFNFRKQEWGKSLIIAVMPQDPFDHGAMRNCFRMTDLTRPPGQQDFVAKQARDTAEPQHTYFADAEMQTMCQYFADEFNKLDPPKLVEFLEVSVVEMFNRPGRPVYCIEPFLKGEYKKHNNNWGFVSPEDRNTPQAFSHFTYVKSNGTHLVCDIQGVGDRYTDPQVHSKDQKGFGKGNMGQDGMTQFFKTHKCNYICQHLGIATKNVKPTDLGTRPPPSWRPKAAPVLIGSGPGPGIGAPKPIQSSSSSPLGGGGGGGIGIGGVPAAVPMPVPAGGGGGRNSNPFEASEQDLQEYHLSREDYNHLVAAFQARDKQGAGSIDKKELVELCKGLGLDLKPAHIGPLLAHIDREGTGHIPFRVFVRWWCGLDN